MPAEQDKLGIEAEKEFLGHEFPAGWGLVFIAAQAGIPLIAVATVGNHHSHPASAMMDLLSDICFPDTEFAPTTPIRMNDSVVIVTNAPTIKYDAPDLGPKEKWTKDWAKVVSWLEDAAASK